MAVVFTSPDEVIVSTSTLPEIDSLSLRTPPVKIFLAGGISGCRDWQKITASILEKSLPSHVLIYNPRRENFSLNSRAEIAKQIDWEFRHLEMMDIFTMFFAASDTSVGPICLYELGRYICRMQMRFPADWQHRIIIDIEDGYLRQQDVIEQVDLATGLQVCPIHHSTPEMHAERIKYGVQWLIRD